MRKKSFITLFTLGIFIFFSSSDLTKAEGNAIDLSKKVIESHVEKPLKKGLITAQTFNQLEKEVKGSRTYSTNASNKLSAINGSDSSSEYLVENEYNDEFDFANELSYEKPTIGQLLPLYDVDFHKIVAPTNGILLIAGGTNSYAIDLLFNAVQKDFVENNNLEYLGSEYDEGIEIQAYQAKPGTYYVGVIDHDNDYYDDNTEDDLYAIASEFIDNIAPDKPTVNKVDNNDKVVTGKSEANSTITIKNGKKSIGTSKVSAKGTFSSKIAVQKAGTKLTITVTDDAGNISPNASVTVADVVAPNKPTIKKVDNNDKAVTGKAEANATVTVTTGKKSLGTAKANSKGSYSVKIKTQKTGTIISVTAKDKAGNRSKAATAKVVKH
ncbi:MAG: Ig-like domain-containing protein [Bacillus sp. (in: firmicutes)]